MHILSYIITEITHVKTSAKKKKVLKTEAEIIEEERARSERIENYIMLLPLIIMLLGIIVMHILYKLFM